MIDQNDPQAIMLSHLCLSLPPSGAVCVIVLITQGQQNGKKAVISKRKLTMII